MVVEEGRHQELLEKEGVYHQLYSLRFQENE
jgi:ABC-type transport system involved in Fe-S cluster assembly fused permease/ATPase subunit